MPGTEMTIGELAARFGLATHVLRHWEDAGLLRPRRDSAGHRRYQDDDAEAVAMILMGQGVGLSLAEIGALATAAPDRATRHGLLRAHRDQLRERIIRTQAALDTLEHALECEAEDFRTCPHFRAHLAHAVRPETDPVSRPQPTLSEGILPIWQKARR